MFLTNHYNSMFWSGKRATSLIANECEKRTVGVICYQVPVHVFCSFECTSFIFPLNRFRWR